MSRIADRNLLWGELALRVDFITRDALVDGMPARASAEGRNLEDILVEQGALSPEQRDALAPLFALHVARFDDPARSLAALSSIGPALDAVGPAEAPDVRPGPGRVGFDPFATKYVPDDEASPAVVSPVDARGPTRYHRLRLHARGNLGEVFIARDHELNRDVALKEIQDRHADREDSRQRFMVEAEITGGLEHFGIVPVYGLGRYPDGRPFYAMRLVKGDSLAASIAAYHGVDPATADPGERSLALRTLLRRFSDVCNAVVYAHARGVLHRDLKPGNIMVGKYGETLVVDWGLARAIGDDHPDDRSRAQPDEPYLSPISGSGLPGTVAGKAVGTPAYMPPEQAEGRLDALGPRSDVYSLGATLYHLLTGRAPFEGGDLAEILGRVVRGDVPPPRSVAPSVPKGLEAICLKAMATRPDDRYPTALALAADLDHWLADEPTEALPDRPLDRLARWSRRHRAATLATTAALLIARARRDTVQALAAQTLATAAQTLATAAEARVTDRMRAVFGQASKATEDLVTLIRDDRGLRETPALGPFRPALLDRALDFSRGFIRENEAEPGLRAEVANAHLQVGSLTQESGRAPDAEPAYREALAAFEALAAERPESEAHREGLARTCDDLGLLLWATSRRDEASQNFVRAREVYERLVAERPESDDYREGLASTCTRLGLWQSAGGRVAEAERTYVRALEIYEQLAAERPESDAYRRGLATILTKLSDLQAKTGRHVEAEQGFIRALRLRERLAAERPESDIHRDNLAMICVAIGYQQFATGRPAEADRSFARARDIYERLVAERPESDQYREALASLSTKIGLLHTGMDRPAEAERSLVRALGLYERLAAERPDRAWYRSDLGRTLGGLAKLFARTGRPDEARRSFREAIGHGRAAIAVEPETLSFRRALSNSLSDLARFEADRGRPAEAEAAIRERRALWPGDPVQLYNAACEFALCVPPVPGGSSDWARYADLAIETLEQAVAAGWSDFDHTGRDADLLPLRDRADFRAMLAAMMDRAMPADPFTPASPNR